MPRRRSLFYFGVANNLAEVETTKDASQTTKATPQTTIAITKATKPTKPTYSLNYYNKVYRHNLLALVHYKVTISIAFTRNKRTN